MANKVPRHYEGYRVTKVNPGELRHYCRVKSWSCKVVSPFAARV